MKHVFRFLVGATIAASASLFSASHASANDNWCGDAFDTRFGDIDRFIDADGDLQIVFDAVHLGPGLGRFVAHADLIAEFACMDLDGRLYDLDARFVVRDRLYDQAGLVADPRGLTLGRFVLGFDPLRMGYACAYNSRPVLLRLTYTNILVKELTSWSAVRVGSVSRRYSCYGERYVGEYIDETFEVGQYVGQYDVGQVDVGQVDVGQVDMVDVGQDMIGKGEVIQDTIGKGYLGQDMIGKGEVIQDTIGKGYLGQDTIGKGDLGQTVVGKGGLEQTEVGKGVIQDTIDKGEMIQDTIGKGGLGQTVVGKSVIQDTIGKGEMIQDTIGKGDLGQTVVGKGDLGQSMIGKGDLGQYMGQYSSRQYIGK